MDWTPPAPWDGDFWFLGADYEFDPLRGCTVFRVGGMTRDDHRISVHVRGHHPRCWVKIKDAERSIAFWEKRARATASLYFNGKSRWAYEKFKNCPRWVLAVEAQKVEDFVEDRPSERVGIRWRIEFVHPALVKMFRDYVEFPEGIYCEKTVPDWASSDPRAVENFSEAIVYEANVDYVERVIVDTGWSPCSWLRAENPSAVEIASSKPERYVSGLRYDVVAHVNASDVFAGGEGPEPKLRILCFDIEADNGGGDRMPRARTDPILNICAWIKRYGEDRAESWAWELGSCDAVAGKTFVFEREGDLLAAFAKVLGDVHVVAAHNGNGFDLPFLVDRANILGVGGWKFLGPIQRATSRGVTKYHGKSMHRFEIPGTLVVDTMLVESKSLGAGGLGLGELSRKYLNDLPKMDVGFDELSRLQKTHRGRSKKHRYCLRDAELVWKIEEQQGANSGAFEMARRSVPPQTVLNRSQGAKGEGLIARKCFSSPVPKIMMVLSFSERFYRGRPRVRTRGNYSGSKKYEGAINLPSVPFYCVPVDKNLPQTIVFVFDFKSLYPSIIIQRNVSPDTHVLPDTIAKYGLVEGVDYWSSPDYSEDSEGRRVVTPVEDNPKFYLPGKNLGVLTVIERELFDERVQVKKAAKDARAAGDAVLAKKLGIKELTIKLIMNSIYGLMARAKAGESVRYFSLPVASTITREGRGLILLTKDIISEKYPAARIIAGDTDSVMVSLTVRDHAHAYEIGTEMEKTLNEYYPKPITLELEGMAVGFHQTKKKNYFKYWCAKGPEGWFPPELEIKGLFMKKRNCPLFFKGACKAVADVLMDLEPRKDRLERLVGEMDRQLGILNRYEVPVGHLIENTRFGKDYGEYVDATKATGLIKRELKSGKRKAGDPLPEMGDVVSTIVVPKSDLFPSAKVTERTVDALDAIRGSVRYDTEYYTERLKSMFATHFGQGVASLTGVAKDLDDLLERVDRKLEEEVEKLKDARNPTNKQLDRMRLLSDPKDYKDTLKRRRDAAQKKFYLDVIEKRLPRRKFNYAGGSLMETFFRRAKTCPSCKGPVGGCDCDLSEILETKKRELKEIVAKEEEEANACRRCVFDRDVTPEERDEADAEVKTCVSFRSCERFSLKRYLVHSTRNKREEIFDIEDTVSGRMKKNV